MSGERGASVSEEPFIKNVAVSSGPPHFVERSRLIMAS